MKELTADHMHAELPWLGASLIWSAVFAVMTVITIRTTGGMLVFTLDDPYISLAVAKNLAAHGQWGVTPYWFSSGASTILWPLLNAAVYLITGSSVIVPFVIGWVCSILALYILDRELRGTIGSGWRFGILMLFAYAVPMHGLLFTGMEHQLQLVIVLLFVSSAGRVLFGDDTKRDRIVLLVLSVLATAIRYESLFLAAYLVATLVWRRRWGFASAVAACAGMPAVLFGVVSKLNGWSVLPNSVLSKAKFAFWTPEGVMDAFSRAHYTFGMKGAFIAMLAASAVLLATIPYLHRSVVSRKATWVLGMFAFASVLHAAIGQFGWFYRYEVYLIGIAAIGFPLLFSEAFRLRAKREWYSLQNQIPFWAAIGCLAMAAEGIEYRGTGAFDRVPRSSANIYEQQIQMSRLLHLHYRGAAIVASDVGAINFYNELQCIDLGDFSSAFLKWGRAQGKSTAEALGEIVREKHASIAVVYESPMMQRELGWVLCGRWAVRKNHILGCDSVAWFAIPPYPADSLKKQLREFSAQLPGTVIQRGPYLNTGTP